VTGDIAWGGNWFYLVSNHGRQLSVSGSRELCDFTLQIRAALESAGITGANGGVIDHIELFGPPSGGHADSQNFVMCPGGAWDRSPCGTGTSAKLACLAADGKLPAGVVWRQESLVGSVFTGSLGSSGRPRAGCGGSGDFTNDHRIRVDHRGVSSAAGRFGPLPNGNSAELRHPESAFLSTVEQISAQFERQVVDQRVRKINRKELWRQNSVQ
jgi:hypothetical protein